MDLILYRHLLRRIVIYPITFSRNKNFDSYQSTEGKAAIKRAKAINHLVKFIETGEFKHYKENNNYIVEIEEENIKSIEKYILDDFEYYLIMEKLDNRESIIKLMKLIQE